jgi:hypothetical protein
MTKMDKSLIGAAGEHLVLSRLLARGMLAAQAPRGVRKADILVNHLDGKPPCLIQVKTRLGVGSRRTWAMNVKHQSITDKDLFYCFVDLGEDSPIVFVIPAKKVAAVINESHKKWMATPGKKGQAHNDNDMRRIGDDIAVPNLKSAPTGWLDEYLENWELITN